MVSIVKGLSRLTGATVILALSWNFPEWLEVYHIRRGPKVLPVTRSFRTLRFNVFLSIMRQCAQVYFFLLPFYCGARRVMIPLSAIMGIYFGSAIDLCAYWGRKHVSDGDSKPARHLVYAMISIAVVSSATLFANGCIYINDVWEAHHSDLKVWLAAFFPWLTVGGVVHATVIDISKRPAPVVGASAKYTNTIGANIAKVVPRKKETNQPQDDFCAEDEVRVGSGNEGDLEDHCLEACPDSRMIEEPSYYSLVKLLCCRSDGERSCFFQCHPKQDTCTLKAISWCSWITWTVLSCFSLYFAIINIGATQQQDVVRAKLPSVKALLFEDMNDNQVCAYNGDGTKGSLNESSVITTFHNKEAAHIAGFLVLHCGACASCSTWPNIKYEYTTRNFLARESARCARMSLLGGRDAVHSCLTAAPIDFDDACGECWTTDVLCAKKHCAFNFLQSTMINSVGNFAVGMEHVTAASCEEANCEAFPYPANFVECSGATRRRMNVTSSIASSKDEECANVDLSWETLFPGE